MDNERFLNNTGRNVQDHLTPEWACHPPKVQRSNVSTCCQRFD